LDQNHASLEKILGNRDCVEAEYGFDNIATSSYGMSLSDEDLENYQKAYDCEAKHDVQIRGSSITSSWNVESKTLDGLHEKIDAYNWNSLDAANSPFVPESTFGTSYKSPTARPDKKQEHTDRWVEPPCNVSDVPLMGEGRREVVPRQKPSDGLGTIVGFSSSDFSSLPDSSSLRHETGTHLFVEKTGYGSSLTTSLLVRCSTELREMSQDYGDIVDQRSTCICPETPLSCLATEKDQTGSEDSRYTFHLAHAGRHEIEQKAGTAQFRAAGASPSMTFPDFEMSADNPGNPIHLYDDDEHSDDDEYQDSISVVSIDPLPYSSNHGAFGVEHQPLAMAKLGTRKRDISEAGFSSFSDSPSDQFKQPRLDFHHLEEHWIAMEASLPKLTSATGSLFTLLARFYASFYNLWPLFDKDHALDFEKVSEAVCRWSEVETELQKTYTLRNDARADDSKDCDVHGRNQRDTLSQLGQSMERLCEIVVRRESAYEEALKLPD
jgi:hypothetical protein